MDRVFRLCFSAGLLLLHLPLPITSHARSVLPSSEDAPRDTSAIEVVVARFSLDVDGLESGFPDEQKATGLAPRVLRARENARLMRESVETLRTPEGTPVKVATDSLFAIVADELRALGLHVLAADTLRDQVPYLLGHPMGSARSVISDGPHTRAIEVEIDVTVPDQGTGYWAILGTGRAKTKGRPEMYLRIRYADANGTTWHEKERVRAKERVELSERWLLGVRSESDISDASSLFDLTREATHRIVRKRLASADGGVR